MLNGNYFVLIGNNFKEQQNLEEKTSTQKKNKINKVKSIKTRKFKNH